MMDATARFALPYLLPGQAQKEFTHNEALALIDAALHPVVEGGPLDQPPIAPAVGQTWLVGPDSVAEWTGKAGQLAIWTIGGWRFVAPHTGMCVWDKASALPRRWTGAAWNDGEIAGSALIVGGKQVVGSRAAAIASASGGTIIDQEARAVLDQVVVALKTHGLIE